MTLTHRERKRWDGWEGEKKMKKDKDVYLLLVSNILEIVVLL